MKCYLIKIYDVLLVTQARVMKCYVIKIYDLLLVTQARVMQCQPLCLVANTAPPQLVHHQAKLWSSYQGFPAIMLIT